MNEIGLRKILAHLNVLNSVYDLEATAHELYRLPPTVFSTPWTLGRDDRRKLIPAMIGLLFQCIGPLTLCDA